MTIDAVQFIDANASVSELSGLQTPSSSSNFAGQLMAEMSELNDQLHQAELNVQQLASGEQDNLHQIMLSLEKAKLSFELAMQVRNKLLEGYQEIMRMQV